MDTEKYDWYDEGIAKGRKDGFIRGLIVGLVIGIVLMLLLRKIKITPREPKKTVQ